MVVSFYFGRSLLCSITWQAGKSRRGSLPFRLRQALSGCQGLFIRMHTARELQNLLEKLCRWEVVPRLSCAKTSSKEQRDMYVHEYAIMRW